MRAVPTRCSSEANTFSSTGTTVHSTLVTGLVNGSNYSYYVRCQDAAGNTNPDDFVITFWVSWSATTSTFSGVESPLSENGMWGTAGSWTAIQKNNGAYSTANASAARIVNPVVSPDQLQKSPTITILDQPAGRE